MLQVLSPKMRTKMIKDRCIQMMKGAYAEKGLPVSAAFAAIQAESDDLARVTTRLMVADVLRGMSRNGEADAHREKPKSSNVTPFVPVHYRLKALGKRKSSDSIETLELELSDEDEARSTRTTQNRRPRSR